MACLAMWSLEEKPFAKKERTVSLGFNNYAIRILLERAGQEILTPRKLGKDTVFRSPGKVGRDGHRAKSSRTPQRALTTHPTLSKKPLVLGLMVVHVTCIFLSIYPWKILPC